MPSRSVFARKSTGTAFAPGSSNSTPAGAASVERPTSALPDRYSTRTTPSFSTNAGCRSTTAARVVENVINKMNSDVRHKRRFIPDEMHVMVILFKFDRGWNHCCDPAWRVCIDQAPDRDDSG